MEQHIYILVSNTTTFWDTATYRSKAFNEYSSKTSIFIAKHDEFPVRKFYHITVFHQQLLELIYVLKLQKFKTQKCYWQYTSTDCSLNVRSRKYVVASTISEIFQIKFVPGKSYILNNFWHSLLSASSDLSFESSGRVLFKNV